VRDSVKVLFVDLNNFSRYPTMSVGYITAVLRRGGHSVDVLSPLAVGVEGYPRVTRPPPWGALVEWAKYRSATTNSTFIKGLRRRLRYALRPTNDTSRRRTLSAVARALESRYDIILISAYTMFFETCAGICALASERGIPVVAGGPLFNHEAVAQHWLTIDGMTGVFGGEPEERIGDLVEEIGSGNLGIDIPGFSTERGFVPAASPLAPLDDLPFPDYSDFPWDRYPNRIIPMMTGRGCGWGVCTFCSDVATSSGRTFRSRSLSNVLEELRWQKDRHSTSTFTFLDLKLNSDLQVWRGLAANIQRVVPGAEWTASVHAHSAGENGLTLPELKAARRAGLVRMTTGLESGSARVLNLMAKGTNPATLSQTVRYASEAGITMRVTVVVGYPGERSRDLDDTRRFLDQHEQYIDRVVVNRFALQIGTPAERAVLNGEERMKAIQGAELALDDGAYRVENTTFQDPAHRAAMRRLLLSAHAVNRKPRSGASRTFEGVM
jgi:anaerobic magnesium-protoporphyrin IX monomethyl ester cyclase